MATHSSVLAWRIPWTEEPDKLQSMGLQRVGHDWLTKCARTHTHRSGQCLCWHVVMTIIRIHGKHYENYVQKFLIHNERVWECKWYRRCMWRSLRYLRSAHGRGEPIRKGRICNWKDVGRHSSLVRWVPTLGEDVILYVNLVCSTITSKLKGL